MKDPFEIMGLRIDCTQAEAQDAYVALRQQYLNDRFLEGEAGATAAKKLTELENAYSDVLDVLSNRYTVDGGSVSLDEVGRLVKENKLDEAQAKLDATSTRGGEWHYYQSLIFYKRGWLTESRKQLQMAISADPTNAKYTKTLEKLEKKMHSDNPFAGRRDETAAEAQANRSYTDPSNTRSTRSHSDDCCKACQALWCLDCLCECMGGDCISCC